MTDQLFGNSSPTQEPTEVQAPSIDEIKAKFGEDINKLAEGKAEADRFILQLQSEMAELRKDLSERLTMSDFLDKLEESKEQSKGTNQPLETSQSQEPTFSQADVSKLVEDQLNQRMDQERKQANITTASTKLKEAWGSDYDVKMAKRISELEVSKEFLTDMASKSPKAFVDLMVGSDKPQSKPSESLFTPPQSTVTVPSAPTGKTWEDYQTMRKENPHMYYSPQVQNEMFRRAKEDPTFVKRN